MKKYIKIIFAALALSAVIISTVNADNRTIYVANNSFADGLASWIYEGGQVSVSGWGYTNAETDNQLNLYLADSAYASAHKTLYNLAPGKYRISAYVRGGGDGEAYMYAKTEDTSVKNNSYTGNFARQSVTLDVFSGKLEFGFNGENGMGLWYNADDIAVECIEEYAADGGLIADNSFENGLGGFSVNGAVTNENGRTGNCLAMPSGSTAEVTVADVEKGFYEVSAYCRSNNADGVIKVSDGVHEASARIPRSDGWTKVVVSGVYTDNGRLDISLIAGNAPDAETYIDDVCVQQSDKYRNFITGGDISAATYLEANGAKYYDAAGEEKDCVSILADSGMNMARVRVYNQTGRATATDKGYGKFYMPDGYQDADDALALCKRAKDNGMQIQFTFHYSDFWTNGEAQEIPMEWRALIEGKTDDEAAQILEDEVYRYTLNIMQRLKAQDTLPELVSIGNEIQFGMLYPYGNVGADAANWKNLSRFLNAGYKAVKEVSPSSRVIIHLDDCGNFAKYEDFFSQCEKNSVSYDIIGTSYYPFWSGKTIEHTVEFCNTLTSRFDKDIIIMETGYNFNPTKPDGWTGQLTDNGPYEEIYPSSPDGHKEFMADLFNGLKSAPRCIGDLYWDPIMIDCDGTGWAIKIVEITDETTGEVTEKDYSSGNVISNTTLFDFDGKALPTLGVFADNSGADYTLDVLSGDEDIKSRFTAVEKDGLVTVTNISDKEEKIVVYTANYDKGVLSGVDIDRRILVPGENGRFENGRYLFVWTQQDIRPVTTRDPYDN